jgi:hypothetical protein
MSAKHVAGKSSTKEEEKEEDYSLHLESIAADAPVESGVVEGDPACVVGAQGDCNLLLVNINGAVCVGHLHGMGVM